MLVLTRHVGDILLVGDNVTIKVNAIVGNRVTLAIEAPREVSIVRGEAKEQRQKALPSPPASE